MGFLLGGPYFPITRGTEMEHTNVKPKDIKSSTHGDSDKGSYTEAPQIGATWQDPVEQRAGENPLTGGERPLPSSSSPENTEGLTEKVGTLGLQVTSKNRCGAAKKWARKARLTKAPSRDSGSGQPRSAPGGQPQALQKPGTSRVQQGKSAESKGPPPGPSKRPVGWRYSRGGTG